MSDAEHIPLTIDYISKKIDFWCFIRLSNRGRLFRDVHLTSTHQHSMLQER